MIFSLLIWLEDTLIENKTQSQLDNQIRINIDEGVYNFKFPETLQTVKKNKITQVSNVTSKNRRQRFQFVDENEISELSRREEEGVTLLQRHRRTELRFVIVVAQVSNLVQVTVGEKNNFYCGSFLSKCVIPTLYSFKTIISFYIFTISFLFSTVSTTILQHLLEICSYWFPNSDATKRNPVLRTFMAVATGTVSKYLSLISVTMSSSFSN